jgi:hypothetical protein
MGATPLRASLVPAYQQCSSGNRTHGAPLAYPSCNPPVQTSSFLTVGTPDANGTSAANAIAYAKFDALPGNAGTTADEADMKITVSASDVRNKSDLTDYAGQLKVSTTTQLIDRDNGPSETGTTQDIPIEYTVPCTTTPSNTAAGSTCALSTTADAVTPNTVKEGRRTIWQMGKVNVYDGGADGVVSTNPNTLYLTQGVFVP